MLKTVLTSLELHPEDYYPISERQANPAQYQAAIEVKDGQLGIPK